MAGCCGSASNPCNKTAVYPETEEIYNPNAYKPLIKCVLIGGSGSGKTSFFNALRGMEFSEQVAPTIGIDFFPKSVVVDEQPIKIQVFDSAGQDRFHSTTRMFYRKTEICFLFYDVTRLESFQEIQNRWIKEIKEGDYDIPLFLVANKKDLNELRVVSQAEGRNYAESEGMGFAEITCKDMDEVEETLMKALRDPNNKKIHTFSTPVGLGLMLDPPAKK
eukprot:TRINITY_DN10568_c0_g1_i1.p1 TRINITY_DN10568_c0_g1~~TRINITY_DN10568_c0_g1_i1.p1  ORF type:complete len:219 (+),score=59.80 TRINITY_DN10568_c0_g1_i1:93-749(+)